MQDFESFIEAIIGRPLLPWQKKVLARYQEGKATTLGISHYRLKIASRKSVELHYQEWKDVHALETTQA